MIKRLLLFNILLMNLFSCSSNINISRDLNNYDRPVYFNEPKFLKNANIITKTHASLLYISQKEEYEKSSYFSDYVTEVEKNIKLQGGTFGDVLRLAQTFPNNWIKLTDVIVGYKFYKKKNKYKKKKREKYFLNAEVEIKSMGSK